MFTGCKDLGIRPFKLVAKIQFIKLFTEGAESLPQTQVL